MLLSTNEEYILCAGLCSKCPVYIILTGYGVGAVTNLNLQRHKAKAEWLSHLLKIS